MPPALTIRGERVIDGWGGGSERSPRLERGTRRLFDRPAGFCPLKLTAQKSKGPGDWKVQSRKGTVML